jgi:signal recognition particle subunit SRP54
VLSLIEKAEREVTEEEASALEQKLLEQTFDLGDFLEQLQMVKRMGPLQNLVGMMPQIPGVGKIDEDQVDEKQLTRVEAVIRSMTPKERARPQIINASRRKRIADGSGTRPQDVNLVLDQFDQMRKMMQKMTGILPRKARKGGRKARKSLPKMKGF